MKKTLIAVSLGIITGFLAPTLTQAATSKVYAVDTFGESKPSTQQVVDGQDKFLVLPATSEGLKYSKELLTNRDGKGYIAVNDKRTLKYMDVNKDKVLTPDEAKLFGLKLGSRTDVGVIQTRDFTSQDVQDLRFLGKKGNYIIADRDGQPLEVKAVKLYRKL